MASAYTDPLTVVRDVETSILDATALEFLYVEQGWWMGEYPGGLNKLQSM